MGLLNRDAQIGLLTRLKQERETLRVEIDAAVKAIVVHFDPMDRDLQYVHAILPERLKVHVALIERKKKRLDVVQEEIDRLAKELNVDVD
jgi:hypothetical protein